MGTVLKEKEYGRGKYKIKKMGMIQCRKYMKEIEKKK